MHRRQTWKEAKGKLQAYRPRKPEASELYRLVYHGRDELVRVWEDRFQPQYGVLRKEVLSTFDEYLNCGLLCHGAARVYCDGCQHSDLVAFSCKKRGVCPSCSAKRAVKFADHLYDEVLEAVPNRHVVFTIPKRLRVYFRYDRALNSILFQAAWVSIKEVLGSECGTAAAVLTAQTAGEALNFHPHLHGCLADGNFAADGSFIPFAVIDQARLTERFGERVLTSLQSRNLISDNDVAQVLSQEHTGFSVWLGEAFSDAESARFVARYIERGPISLEKLSIQDHIVTYCTKDGAAHEFDALEFLALLSSHIAKPYESLVRYFGFYSCRARGERKKRAVLTKAEKSEVSEPLAQLSELEARPSSSWAACIKRVFEVDPLECPKCKAGMRIVAFIKDQAAIKRIMQALNLPSFAAPEKIPRAPPPADQYPDFEHFN